MTFQKITLVMFVATIGLEAFSLAQAQDMGRVIEGARQLREKLLKDPYRPACHFVTIEPQGAKQCQVKAWEMMPSNPC
ncbi:MAG: hypothetical protein NTU94_06270 [Planctomycetota bacterium]|nr:hypothetical protein [Planctomycetota bacterium]